MNIGFIGAGKMGCTLGRYFREAGEEGSLHVKGYYSRSDESAKDAASFTDSDTYDSMNDLIDECDAIFLTVHDGSIAEVWQQAKRCDLRGKTICHCSGVMSAQDAFEGLKQTGAYGYSIHPLFAVSDKYNAYRELTGVFFTLEGGKPDADGHSEAFMQLRTTLETMGNPTKFIDGRDKTVYHCAAAVASNLVCGLIDQSLELMQRCGFSQEEATRALAPILTGNMEHIAKVGPEKSLTGPVERNDADTVAKHLQCLEAGEETELYRLLSRRLVKLACHRHPERDYGRLVQLLD